jgi:phosphatidylglycerol:prolipoprotein diacylglycerol transferase
MASHGGILGVIVAMLWFSRKVKIPFYQLADAAALCTPIGLGLGRIANFINGELWGRPTEVPWAVIFPHAPRIMGEQLPRHPSQLYEFFLEGLLLFILLWIIRQRTQKTGVVALSFMGFYALLRILGEQFREPDIEIGYLWGGLTQGQALSMGMLAVTFVLVIFQWKEWRK